LTIIKYTIVALLSAKMLMMMTMMSVLPLAKRTVYIFDVHLANRQLNRLHVWLLYTLY